MNLDEAANELVRKLRERSLKVVFAESCTGGLVSASLATIAGVSDCLCGSAVTYLDEVKTQWLGVDPALIRWNTAVCQEVAEKMASGALQRTSSADIAVSITGHLGPDAPPQLDGIVFVAFAWRIASEIAVIVQKLTLVTLARGDRQVEAAVEMLKFARNETSAMGSRKGAL